MPDTNLSNCDREPIHIPGAIQTHGVLFAFDEQMQMLQQHSANCSSLLGIPLSETADGIFGEALTDQLRNALVTDQPKNRPTLFFAERLPSGAVVDIAIHQNGGTTIAELEPAPETTESPLRLTRSMTDAISDCTSVRDIVAQVTRTIRGKLGYDRVMVYEFATNGSGKVIAEDRSEGLESFLGQHFPATDIPVQARRLYRANTIRLITDASNARSALVPETHHGLPLDLSHAHLRAVSPIHCEYLRNMGVAASMSISILVDGELWGLIACHHYSPRTLSMYQRVAAEMFGEFLSLHIGALIHKAALDSASEARRRLENLAGLGAGTDVAGMLRSGMNDLCALIPCDGVALVLEDELLVQGAVPPNAAIRNLAADIPPDPHDLIWKTDSLVTHTADAENYAERAAGVLAVQVSQQPQDWVMFFRREQVQKLEWAGNPEKSYTSGPMGDRLTPRKSFALWKEDVHRHSDPWTKADMETVRMLRTSLVEPILRQTEAMAEERARADLRQRVLNDELNHRVKNILAVIKSVIGHPVEEGRTLESYVQSLKGRIQALSLAHDQVMRGDGGGSLGALLAAELAPYGDAAEIWIEGQDALLDSRGFSVMAQVLHELATNAAKYGALSAPDGALQVTWYRTSEGDCHLTWIETGGPAVIAPDHTGFGSLLLKRSLPFDLGGSSHIEYLPTGVKAEFTLPARHVRFKEIQMSATTSATSGTDSPTLPEQAHVMLLEDQLLIAMDVEAMLEESGFQRISLARNVAQAMDLIKGEGIELAMLDVNLGQETSIPVAEELRARGIPFVFATGYDEGSALPEGMRDVTIVRKPYDIDNLVQALTSAFHRT
ncbi:HWE histidine kinase domain-containing protein [Falsirhodobacter sp. alg1]|uniref:HWE histidine kinase domain-containing protein n=1 Tax=Falsirhodobacter sp. alg1 TaxID=1472418 RepID=UPI0005EFDA5A|nr:HWE histidine kinase domain-containing protein [Falsirhodobacter sp. alg1]